MAIDATSKFVVDKATSSAKLKREESFGCNISEKGQPLPVRERLPKDVPIIQRSPWGANWHVERLRRDAQVFKPVAMRANGGEKQTEICGGRNPHLADETVLLGSSILPMGLSMGI